MAGLFMDCTAFSFFNGRVLEKNVIGYETYFAVSVVSEIFNRTLDPVIYMRVCVCC